MCCDPQGPVPAAPHPVKVGQVLQVGLIPCKICKKPHKRVVTAITPTRSSWAMDDHIYEPMEEGAYIQQLHSEIKKLRLALVSRINDRNPRK